MFIQEALGAVAATLGGLIEGQQALIGVVVGYFLGIRRDRAQEKQRDRLARDAAWRQRQLDAIATFQEGVHEAHDGAWVARCEIEAFVERVRGGLAVGKLPAVPEQWKEPWHQEWRASLRRAEYAVSRVDDAELTVMIEEFNALSHALIDANSQAEADQLTKELAEKVRQITERAGQLYRNFDAPVEDDHQGFRRWLPK